MLRRLLFVGVALSSLGFTSDVSATPGLCCAAGPGKVQWTPFGGEERDCNNLTQKECEAAKENNATPMKIDF